MRLVALDPQAALLPRAGIVHRLDKDTSGLMVVAKTLPAMTALVRLIAAREVRRVYLALAHGRIAWPQASIDAYGALKQLHQAGLTPVLAPLQTDAGADVALQPVVDSVADCAERHLGLPVQVWPTHTWGLRVLDSALTRHHTPTRQPGQRPAAQDGRRAAAAAQPLWS